MSASERATRNRRIIAEAQHWPAGTVEACEELERRFPEWRVFWLIENTFAGFEHPAQFSAIRETPRTGRIELTAAGAEELAEAILLAPPDVEPTYRWLEPGGR